MTSDLPLDPFLGAYMVNLVQDIYQRSHWKRMLVCGRRSEEITLVGIGQEALLH